MLGTKSVLLWYRFEAKTWGKIDYKQRKWIGSTLKHSFHNDGFCF